MSSAVPGLSLTESVYARLRADILAVRLEPGQKLKIEELCSRFAAGSSAVREALSRLASENFVSLEPQRGFRVTLLSIDDFRDLTSARVQIEALCLRSAVGDGDLEWETNLIAALHRMSGTPTTTADDPIHYSQPYVDAHTGFHEALVAACSSRWLLTMRRFLFAQSERYRVLSLPLGQEERDLDGEHRAIAAAALARDPERCVALMRQHLELTVQTLDDASAQGIAPFLTDPIGRPGRGAKPLAKLAQADPSSRSAPSAKPGRPRNAVRQSRVVRGKASG